jgi:hypothetical protein
MEVDPRYAMAQVYKALRGKAELTDQFTTEVNNCNGPADAFKICMKYLSLANASEVVQPRGRSRGASQFVLARPPRSIFI